DQCRQTTEELEGREDELGSTAPPGTLQAVRDHSSRGQGETREGERRSAGGAPEPLEAAPLPSVLHDYFAWATTTTMSRYHQSADEVPEGLTIPRWSWDGLWS